MLQFSVTSSFSAVYTQLPFSRHIIVTVSGMAFQYHSNAAKPALPYILELQTAPFDQSRVLPIFSWGFSLRVPILCHDLALGRFQ